MGITTSTHFAKPKLEQKHNSLHTKKLQSAKIHYSRIKKKIKKRPLDLSQEKTSSSSKNSGDPKRNENSYKPS